MKIIKKNKFTIIAIILFIGLVFGLYQVKKIFFPNEGKAIYGDRLVGKVEVADEIYQQVKTKIQENEKVEQVDIRENGETINISITVKNDTSIEDSKKTINNVLEPFTDSQKGYYDFQIFIYKTDKAENNFPIIGYKHHNSTEFVWSKDREKTDISTEGGE